MENKLKTQIEDRLLESRRESLKQLNNGSMRSHGKLWGMDVFSWSNPDPGIIANTLQSFPFPVIWIGNGSDIVSALKEEELVLNNLQAVITYDSNVFNFEESWLNGIENCAGTKTVSDAIHFLNMFKSPQSVLMFTSSGTCHSENMAHFEDFLKLVQVK